MLKTGIVGCGNIGHMHAKALLGAGVELKAAADIQLEKAETYRRLYGGEEMRVYSSLEEMLEKENLDTVHLCTPHYLHVPMAKTALRRGVHVFMEKPPALSKEEFTELEKRKAETGKEVGICFQNRYNKAVEMLLEILLKKELGAVLGARAFVTWNRQEAYYRESGWRGSWQTEGGGVLINQAIHTLDLLVYLLGKPVRAEASYANHHLRSVIEVEDTLEAYLEFPSARAVFYATNGYTDDAPVLLELHCEKGKIRMEGGRLEIEEKGKTRVCYDLEPQEGVPGKKYWGNSHQACIQDFYDCLLTGKPYRNSLEGVKDSFFLAMDLYASAKENSKGVEMEEKL